MFSGVAGTSSSFTVLSADTVIATHMLHSSVASRRCNSVCSTSCNLSTGGSERDATGVVTVGCPISEHCRAVAVSWRGPSCGVVLRIVSLLLRGFSVFTRLPRHQNYDTQWYNRCLTNLVLLFEYSSCTRALLALGLRTRLNIFFLSELRRCGVGSSPLGGVVRCFCTDRSAGMVFRSCPVCMLSWSWCRRPKDNTRNLWRLPEESQMMRGKVPPRQSSPRAQETCLMQSLPGS